jgi:hypothetical protein
MHTVHIVLQTVDTVMHGILSILYTRTTNGTVSQYQSKINLSSKSLLNAFLTTDLLTCISCTCHAVLVRCMLQHLLKIGGSSEALTNCIQHLTDATAAIASAGSHDISTTSSSSATAAAVVPVAPPTMAWLDSKRLLAWALYEVFTARIVLLLISITASVVRAG